jgi:hypothetical protein
MWWIVLNSLMVVAGLALLVFMAKIVDRRDDE